MKLDPKIKANAIIGHCFNTGEMTKYIGQECYFSDNLQTFGILSNSIKRVLTNVDPDREYPYDTRSNDNDGFLCYSFCLPAEFVEEKPKEKQYRPYTLEEFCDMGFEFVVFRDKDDPSLEFHVRYNGYRKCDNTVILGNLGYTLNDLFEDYEYLDNDGNWKPFGVEE